MEHNYVGQQNIRQLEADLKTTFTMFLQEGYKESMVHD